MHHYHCTAFAHQYEHHHTGMRIYDYTDADGVNRLYRETAGKYYVPCGNDLQTLKSFYTLTARNVLIVINKHSGRMVRLASQPEQFGINHTVQEEAERIKCIGMSKAGERWAMPLRVEFKGDSETLSKIVEEIRRTPLDYFDTPLVVYEASLKNPLDVGTHIHEQLFDNSHTQVPPRHSNCPCFTVPLHLPDDLSPAHAKIDSLMERARKAVQQENEKREELAAERLKKHLEVAIYRTMISSGEAYESIPFSVRAKILDDIDLAVKGVIDDVTSGELKI